MEKKMVNDIIKILSNRKGFDYWWSNIDSDIKKEIKIELINIIKSNKI